MPAQRINMRKLKDALRLKLEGGQSHQQIANALGISKGVITKYVGLAVAARLDWPAIAEMDEAGLERRLLPAPRPSDLYAQADYGRIHQELRRKGMTLALLWEEYCAQTGEDHSPSNPVKPWRYSPAMLGRPPLISASYIPQNSASICTNAALTIRRMALNGCPAGMKSSSWRKVNRLSVKVSAPRMNFGFVVRSQINA